MTVDGVSVGSIGRGLLVLVGVTHGDEPADAEALARKIVGLRVFADGESKMNLSLADIGASCLVVSQFTLYGSVRRGRRPSFTSAADPAHATELIGHLVAMVGSAGVPVAEGEFGAMMEVELVNDGPVTLVIETDGGRVV